MSSTIAELQYLLAQQNLCTPQSTLANLKAWLDPYGLLQINTYDEDPDGDQYYEIMSIARDCFPDIYTGAIQRVWRGYTNEQIGNWVAQNIGESLGLDVAFMEDIIHYIPTEVAGLDLDDPDTYEMDARFIHVCRLMRFKPDCNDKYPANPFWVYSSRSKLSITLQAVRNIANVLAKHLIRQQFTPATCRLLCLFYWIFSISDNTLVDYSPDEFNESGIEPLDWTRSNINLAREMIDQANLIIRAAGTALDDLTTNLPLQTAIYENTYKVIQMSKKRKGKLDYDRLYRQLRWPPCLNESPERAATDHDQLLQLWRDSQEAD